MKYKKPGTSQKAEPRLIDTLDANEKSLYYAAIAKATAFAKAGGVDVENPQEWNFAKIIAGMELEARAAAAKSNAWQ
ncbi:MAG: hypothetical protein FWG10_03875 [Eubacteriaceae bacterium]|nr:hypothetical protein [Eubacteriaceae bacterium]